MAGRAGMFIAVGVIGFIVQIASLWALTSIARWPWLPASLLAVELAIAHNFLWHERWTWRDRPQAGRAARFVRFNAGNGLASLAANAALMGVFVGILGWPPVMANVIAVCAISIVNFGLADRWVFAAGLVAVMAVAPRAESTAVPPMGPLNQPETVAAWEKYVKGTEARLEPARPWTASRVAEADVAATGQSIGVSSGTISDWHGSVFIRGITLDQLLQGLQHPGTPPPQEDVVSSRVLSRAVNSLRIQIRLVRRMIVSVTYDTEHDMTFHRWSPTVATARSVARRIEEVGGDDHGFLWRLHSYWRYEQRPGGVLVELKSLTLSRSVPVMVRPAAMPLVNRIARESMQRTLEALRRHFERA